jgi:N-carbamoyl-L-amino-acid hydrolase
MKPSEVAEEVNAERLVRRLGELGEVGRDGAGRTRLALTPQDKEGRDLIVGWLREAGAQVKVDRIGNIYGCLPGRNDGPPIMLGSHIDTVVRAGAYDGCYGVIAGIEVLHCLSATGSRQQRSVAVAAFTNEEGVRFTPDLLGSRVMAKNIALEEALDIHSSDGNVVREELERIGYLGDLSPWELLPAVFLELHIEQGPVLDASGIGIGIVEAVQGHSWWRVVIDGMANHAGTTPMDLRQDAGVAAMQIAIKLHNSAAKAGIPRVATIGSITVEPNAINVVPGKALLTVDFRDPDEEKLREAERLLEISLRKAREAGFRASAECISRSSPVRFDPALCSLLEQTAAHLGLSARRMLSGASHDAQMLAGICPTAMIFVPSRLGISHNSREHTEPAALAQGAQLLLETTRQLAVVGESNGITGIRAERV